MGYDICSMAKMRKTAAVLIAFVFILGIVLGAAGCGAAEKEKFQKTYLDAFDTAVSVIGYSESKEEFENMAETYVHKELTRYHRLYDIYTEYKGINNIRTVNKNAGISPVEVDDDIIAMLEFSRDMYYATDGKVNIAMGSVLEIWHEARNHGINYPDKAALPDIEELKKASEHCSIEDMVIDKVAGTVYLADAYMRLDVGAVAKGYATERIAQELEADGYTNIILNVGGNIRAIGAKADGSMWAVGIQNPDLASDTAHIETIETDYLSLATSGVYQRYYTVDGKNYHHIIDGITLMPEDRYLSVSVLTDNAGIADALSTALFNMDYADGRRFAEGFMQSADAADKDSLGKISVFEVMWVMPDGEKRYTDGFKEYIVK
ncbi:MAG: FAD:protein FMN transferase [Firmicutes bacterium]|nr:FAD:protein FMN transferase [Bacillota bacterium]